MHWLRRGEVRIHSELGNRPRGVSEVDSGHDCNGSRERSARPVFDLSRTPAQQAGLVGRRLPWREILATPTHAFRFARVAPVIPMASWRSIRVRIAA